MKKTIEVELKYQIDHKESVMAFLKSLKLQKEDHTIDVYLDTDDGALFKRGIFIRIRNGNVMDFKFNLAHVLAGRRATTHVSCEELSFAVPLDLESLDSFEKVCLLLELDSPSRPSLEEFMKINNLIESVVTDKKRKTYDYNGYTICYDDVSGLGSFIEIEYLASENDDVKTLEMEMENMLSDLVSQRITVGYNELYWRKNNFDLYLQGKYLLECDR